MDKDKVDKDCPLIIEHQVTDEDMERVMDILVSKAIEIAKERRQQNKEKLAENIPEDSQLLEKKDNGIKN